MGSQPLNHPDVCPSCEHSLWDEIMRPGNSEMVDIAIPVNPAGGSLPMFWKCPFCAYLMPYWDATSPLGAEAYEWATSQEHVLTTEGPIAYPGGKNGWYITTCSCGGSPRNPNWWGPTEQASRKAALEHQAAREHALRGVRS